MTQGNSLESCHHPRFLCHPQILLHQIHEKQAFLHQNLTQIWNLELSEDAARKHRSVRKLITWGNVYGPL